MDFKYKSQKEITELNDEQVEAYVKGLKEYETELRTKEIETAVKSAKDEFEAKLKEVSAEKELMQKHLDSLDVKIQAKVKSDVKNVDNIKSAILEGGEKIKGLSNEKVQVKAVGDMTTANLVGDEPRSYNYDIVKFPSQKVNVSDIVGSVNIDGGTYTYTIETGAEGSIGSQTEGATKDAKDYDFKTVDVATDFVAGFARYSKKMRNNLSYIASAIPDLLRRDYFKAENSAFNAIMESDATASTVIITGNTKAGMIVDEISKLEEANYEVNGILVRPSDYYSILKTAKQDLMAIVTFEGGVLRINGLQVLKATWLTANKYFVGDFSRVNKINTEGLSLEFSDVEGTNFVKNNITARIESQTNLAVEQPLALVFGDFTATA